jgi:PST family polysaccharide transporter
MDLKRKVVSGSLWSLLGSGGQRSSKFQHLLYLARRSGASDNGRVELEMVFLSIFRTLSRFGQIETLQRYQELDDRVVSTSFWMLLGSGAASCAVIAAIAVALSASGAYAALGNVLLLMAPLSALQAWNAVPEAMLRQRLDFRVLTVRSWVATLAGGAVAIYLAHNNFGVYALVGQRLTTAAAQTVILWALLGWRPRRVFDRLEARRLLGLGSQIMLAGLSGTINLRIADAITGFFLGSAQLGFLRLGWRFLDVIVDVTVTPIASVALSSFSKLRGDLPALRRAYLRLSQFMAIGSLPLFFGLGAVADVFIPLAFGARWLPAVDVLRLLGFLILAGTVNYFFGSVMVAVGQAGVVLRQSVAQIVITAPLLAIGAYWGLEGVLVGHISRAFLVALYNMLAMRRAIGLSPLAIIRTLAPPTLACALMVAAVRLAKVVLAPELAPLPLLIALVAIGGVAYALALLAGDAVGLWRGFVSGAARSLAVALGRKSLITAGRAP